MMEGGEQYHWLTAERPQPAVGGDSAAGRRAAPSQTINK